MPLILIHKRKQIQAWKDKSINTYLTFITHGYEKILLAAQTNPIQFQIKTIYWYKLFLVK